jgi:hypothetical protein
MSVRVHHYGILQRSFGLKASITPVNTYLQMAYPDSLLSFFLACLGTYVLPIVSHPATLSLIAFLGLRSLGELPSFSYSRLGRIVHALAPLTFGIFLSHHLLLTPTMEMLDKMLGLGSTESWFLVLCAIPSLTVLFYVATAGMIYLFRWSRYLKFLAP